MSEHQQQGYTHIATTATNGELSSHLELAAEALLDGWTRAQVIEVLIGCIKRDQGYLAYRKAHHRRTRYDDRVEADLRALALAACWLTDLASST